LSFQCCIHQIYSILSQKLVFCRFPSVFYHFMQALRHTVHKILQNSWEISFTHTSLITFRRSLALDGCFSGALFFILVHRFWIGFRSGLLPVQSRTLIRFSGRKVLATFDRWQGAPACMKIIQLCTAI